MAAKNQPNLPLKGHKLVIYQSTAIRNGYGDIDEVYQVTAAKCSCGVELGKRPGYNPSFNKAFTNHCLVILGAG